MACDKRLDTGTCAHHQCEHKDRTEHGYDCVGIVTFSLCQEAGLSLKLVGKCEVGLNCVEECPYSYKDDV